MDLKKIQTENEVWWEVRGKSMWAMLVWTTLGPVAFTLIGLHLLGVI